MTSGINEKELNSFTKNTSNTIDIREYLEKWSKKNTDINKDLDKEKEEFSSGDNNLEIVITDNEDNKGDENNKDLADFIIEDKEEDKEDEEEL